MEINRNLFDWQNCRQTTKIRNPSLCSAPCDVRFQQSFKSNGNIAAFFMEGFIRSESS